MKIKNWVLPVIVFVVFWGAIGVSMAAGVWQAKQTKEDITVTSAYDLKGWMTLKDISVHTKSTPGELTKVLGIPENTARNKKLKDIAAENGVSTEELKDRLSQYFTGSRDGNTD